MYAIFISMSRDEPYDKSFALLMWLAWLLGAAGIHRIYLGKPVSGVIYFLTWGLFGVGQVVDLLSLGKLVDEANANKLPVHRPPHQLGKPRPSAPGSTPDELARIQLLNAAKVRGNTLSVPQGVMATGKTFKEVEDMLDKMAASGYVGIDNDPQTGAVVYTFGDL